MIKKVDKLILSSFIGPFILTLLVVVFILLSRQMLLYFDDIIGKDLGWEIVMRLLFYFCLFMLPMALPLAILLSSLITFGNLSEHFELTAIKSAGISLLRVIRPIFVFVLLVTCVAFNINNNLVPHAALEAFSLMYDIREKKPALDLDEGTFYNGLPNLSVKVNRKFPDGVTVGDIMLYDHTKEEGNTEVIMADSGRMSTILGDRYLNFELFNGYRYAEGVNQETQSASRNIPHTEMLTRARFDKYQVVIDLSSFDLMSTPKEGFAGNGMMKNLTQLQTDIDSLNRKILQSKPFRFSPLICLGQPAATESESGGQPLFSSATAVADSILLVTPTRDVIQASTNRARQVKAQLLSRRMNVGNYTKEKIVFQIQSHKIISNAIMCIIMFLIGCPLGAIIKRGGLGIPFLLSISLYVTYYILNLQGEKLALQEFVTPTVGVWIPTLIFLCLGFFLLRQAKADARLLESGPQEIANIFGMLRDRANHLVSSITK